jgi:hypothetical protein
MVFAIEVEIAFPSRLRMVFFVRSAAATEVPERQFVRKLTQEELLMFAWRRFQGQRRLPGREACGALNRLCPKSPRRALPIGIA